MSSIKPNRKRPTTQKQKADQRRAADDFATVARRLECDEDKATFEKKLGKIAKAKVRN